MTPGQRLPVDEMGEPPFTAAQRRAFDVLAVLGQARAAGRTDLKARLVHRGALHRLMRYGLAEYVSTFSDQARLTAKGRQRASVEHGLPAPEDGLSHPEAGLPDVEDAPDPLAEFY